jgi:cytosine/adenosine deaminase-related metal-dependent hydrolase
MAADKQLLTGARIYRHDGDRDMPPVADLLIENGKIAAIGTRAEIEDAAAGATAIDLSHHVLLPGFVNTHYHSHDVLAKGSFESMSLEQWGLVAGPMGNNRSLEEVRIRTLLGAIECLRNGITTVQDFCAFMPLEDRYVDTILDAYAEAGIRVIFSITVRDRSQLASTPWAEELVPPHLRSAVGDVAADTDTQLAFVERQIERIGGRNGTVIWALSPSAPQRCTPRLLRGVVDLAARRRVPIYTHVYESRGQKLFAADRYPEHGGSMVAFMESVGLVGPHVTLAHSVWPDPGEIEALARTGTGVVLNMLSNLRLRNGVAPLAAYRRLGVNLALGCDNCSCSDVQSMFQVMKLYALLGGIMEPTAPAPSAAEALRVATLGGARSAGRGETLGALEPGRAADIVAIDLRDPAFRPLHSVVRQVVFAETGRAVRQVWVDGRQVVRDGRAAFVDEDRMLETLGTLMPGIKQQLTRLHGEAEKLGPIFAEIQRRSWDRDLGYSRYLQGN